MTLPELRDVGDMPAPVTVVGDVHLSARRPEVRERFLAFLGDVRERGGTLVLLGDIFDRWVGRRQAEEPFEKNVIEALRELARSGVSLAFVGGNRDFLFDGADGLDIELWPDVVRARWDGRSVVLSHGDLLCTADHEYHEFRKQIRHPIVQVGRRAVPYAVAVGIARWLRGVSGRARKVKSLAQMDIDYGEARRWLDGYGADALVVGHVHTGVHHRLPGDPDRDVYVLKDWEARPNAVVFDEDGIRLAAT